MGKKRAIIIVIDSMGCGAMPDHADFGDTDKCNTLRNVCEFNNGLNLPNMESMGLGNIQDFKGVNKTSTPIGQYGTLQEKSKGKDTTTGHWEIAGLVSEKPFARNRYDYICKSDLLLYYVRTIGSGYSALLCHQSSGKSKI